MDAVIVGGPAIDLIRVGADDPDVAGGRVKREELVVYGA